MGLTIYMFPVYNSVYIYVYVRKCNTYIYVLYVYMHMHIKVEFLNHVGKSFQSSALGRRMLVDLGQAGGDDQGRDIFFAFFC